jgi:hypothetical protein
MKSVERFNTTVAATMAKPANQSARQNDMAFDDTDLTTCNPSTSYVMLHKANANNVKL